MAFEAEPTIWRDGQARVTFADVLEGENLARPMRYGRFVEAVKRFGLDKVREIGVDSAIEGAKLVDAKQCERFVEQAASAASERGIPYSGQQARALRASLTEPAEVVLPHERKQGRIAELEAENGRLRDDLRKVIGHTGYLPGADKELLAGLLASCARISKNALAQGEVKEVKP